MYNPDTVHIIGIDCAADPSKIAVASARPAGDRMTIQSVFRGNGGEQPRSQRLHCLAAKIAQKIDLNSPTLLAIDAPLGWPISMGQALSSHEAGSSLPERCAKMFFRRRTDRFVEEQTGKTPIEVGANLIARVSHTALRLLEMMRTQLRAHLITGPLTSPENRSGAVRVVEVYPALASPFFLDCLDPQSHTRTTKKPTTRDPRRRCWEILAKNLTDFKKMDWNTIRESIGYRLCIDTPSWCGGHKFWSSGPSRDHGLDAILCAWTAWRFLQGECVPPEECCEPDSAPSQLSREGWIWFDKRTRDSIASCSSCLEARPD